MIGGFLVLGRVEMATGNEGGVDYTRYLFDLGSSFPGLRAFVRGAAWQVYFESPWRTERGIERVEMA